MILKIVTLFLVVIAALAMFGKLKWPTRAGLRSQGKCRKCGRPRIGRGACPCEARS